MRKLIHPFIAIALIIFTSNANALASLPQEVNGKRLPSLAPMLEKVIPAVVNVATESTTIIKRDPFFDDPIFRHFFNVPDQPRKQRSQSLGSGVIIDAKKGYILTNNHVIAKADKIMVTLNSGKQFTAKVIGVDPESDIAVIQVPAEGLTAIPIADSSQLRVGDFVVAIGNPFGLGQTVTSGIVSAMGRSGLGIEGYEDFIQTDASINPGNSGGALVNLNGELIGLNTAILSRSGGNIGIGFAIPINMATQVMKQLIEHGEVKRGILGVHVQDLTPDLARAFNIKATKGAVIAKVINDSAADKAGLKSGDIVTAINGKPVKNAATMRNAVGLLRVGQRIKIDIVRDGNSKTLYAKISEATEQSGQVQQAKSLHKRLEGAVLGNIEDGSPLFGKVEGVLVVDVEAGSPAYRAGIRKNDIIISVNRARVRNIKELQNAIKRNSKSLLMNIQRGNGALFLLLQ